MSETSDVTLTALGWTAEREAAFAPHAADGLYPARVTSASNITVARSAIRLVEVVVQRRFRRATARAADMPVVGDWLALQPLPSTPSQGALREVLPRATSLTRSIVSASRPDSPAAAQVIAANVDVALIVSAFGHDLNARRIERYLLAALAGGIRPVIVLNKADLDDSPGAAAAIAAVLAAVAAVVGETPIHAISARTGAGLAELSAHLGPGTTTCLLGSSGVGKSTLTNALLGEERQLVHEVRSDDERGRHTTVSREMFELPTGALLIDTPGLRAVGLWDDGSGLAEAFADVAKLAQACRFGDCSHMNEPGCAVLEAVARGELTPDRVDDLRRLEREVRALELRSDIRSARETQRRQGRIYRDAAKATRWKGWQDG
ncbi:ribosome small subunit-dependent GTPase A [soil metagenome]